MPVTVRFNPQAGSVQSSIIPDATERNAGVMSPDQAQALARLVDTFAISTDTVTTDVTPTVAATYPIPQDGITSTIVNISAANPDGTDWAIWIIAAAIVARSSGVVTLIAPAGPQVPTAQAGATSAAWTIEVVTTADGYDIQVVGAVGVTVKWNAVLFVNYNVL